MLNAMLGGDIYKRSDANIKKGREIMANKFIRVEEVAKELEVSIPYAYKLIKKLNDELEAKGFITIAGRVSRKYFNQRLFGTSEQTE